MKSVLSPRLGRPAIAAIGLLATGCLLVTAGCGGGGESQAAVEGRQQFIQICATCHGYDARGVAALGKDLHDNDFVRSKSDDELLEFLEQGRPANHPENSRGIDMPPRGGNPAFTDEQLRQIVAYLRSIG